MAQKRLRIFAGPNGSGKSSMLRQVIQSVSLGNYINADEIEKLFTAQKSINLNSFGIKSDEKTLHKFFMTSGFAKNKSDAAKLKNSFSVEDNVVKIRDAKKLTPKYTAAILADFLREENLKAGNDFSFETVMSHPDKIKFIEKANNKGYHCYLYFICTDDVRVNIARVRTRVIEGGHTVPEEKIKTRYMRTLSLLYDALKVCYKSYLFDNSDKMQAVARINRDKSLLLSVTSDKLPYWFIKNVWDRIKN